MNDDAAGGMTPVNLLLFDGDCAVCDTTVQWMLRRDSSGVLSYAPLSGPTAQGIRERHPEWPKNLDSLVLVQTTEAGENLFFYSTSVLASAAKLSGGWAVLASVLLWIPALVRDPFYWAFARLRYRVFGRIEACRIPEPHHAERFLP